MSIAIDRSIYATISAIKAVNASVTHSFAIGRTRESASQYAYAAAREHLAMPHDVYGIVSDAIEAAYGLNANGVWIAA